MEACVLFDSNLETDYLNCSIVLMVSGFHADLPLIFTSGNLSQENNLKMRKYVDDFHCTKQINYTKLY